VSQLFFIRLDPKFVAIILSQASVYLFYYLIKRPSLEIMGSSHIRYFCMPA